MKYEYQSIMIVQNGYTMEKENILKLNEYFKEGWEYVDSIVQHKDYSGVGVILRRPLENENLLP